MKTKELSKLKCLSSITDDTVVVSVSKLQAIFTASTDTKNPTIIYCTFI